MSKKLWLKRRVKRDSSSHLQSRDVGQIVSPSVTSMTLVWYEKDKDEHQLKNMWRKYFIFEFLEPSRSEALIKTVINYSIIRIN